MAKKIKTQGEKTKKEVRKTEPVVVHHKRRWSMIIPAFSILLLIFAISLAIYSRYFTYTLNQDYGISSPSLSKEASRSVGTASDSVSSDAVLDATSVDQLVVKTGAYTISVENAEDAVGTIEDVAKDLDGTVSSSQVFHDVVRCDYATPLLEKVAYDVAYSYPYGCQSYNAYVVIRVPKNKYEDAKQAIADVDENKEFDEEQASETDVTDQVVDLEVRLKTLRTEETALLGLLEDADALEDILKVRTELTSIRTQIESLDAQLKNLDKDVELSQITVYVRELTSGVSEAKPSIAARFKIAWEAMKQDISGIGTGLIYIAVYSLIYVPVVLLVLLLIWLIARFIHKHNK